MVVLLLSGLIISHLNFISIVVEMVRISAVWEECGFSFSWQATEPCDARIPPDDIPENCLPR
jgi:hypothetical protein